MFEKRGLWAQERKTKIKFKKVTGTSDIPVVASGALFHPVENSVLL
jgi:hypothetical protein